MSEDLPPAGSASPLTIAGVTLRCYVLQDGRRIIDADDARRLLEAIDGGAEIDPAEAAAFAQWQKGR